MKRKDEEEHGGMKLRSGKVVSAKVIKLPKEVDSSIKKPLVLDKVVVTSEIRLAIVSVIDKLKDILKDNKKFANILVEKSLSIGKGVYTDEIKSLLFKEYPKLFEDENRTQLFDVASDLGGLIYGNHELTRKEMIKHPKKEWDKYRNMLRDKIEKEVRDIFFSSEDIESVDSAVVIIGESEE